jgi:hypothetical protein
MPLVPTDGNEVLASDLWIYRRKPRDMRRRVIDHYVRRLSRRSFYWNTHRCILNAMDATNYIPAHELPRNNIAENAIERQCNAAWWMKRLPHWRRTVIAPRRFSLTTEDTAPHINASRARTRRAFAHSRRYRTLTEMTFAALFKRSRMGECFQYQYCHINANKPRDRLHASTRIATLTTVISIIIRRSH